MRVLGFQRAWPKLNSPSFTTFRFPRLDKDWEVGELVQVIVHPRRKGGGDKLGIARIAGKDLRYWPPLCSEDEAKADGFDSWEGMRRWLLKTYGHSVRHGYMNKLTLEWFERFGGAGVKVSAKGE